VIPQDSFTIAAQVRKDQVAPLRDLLATMTARPGTADPNNTLIPFARFEQLHFVRLVVLDDTCLGDLAAYGTSFPDAPIWLVFLGDCDGPAADAIAAVARDAAPGIARIFAHCADFDPAADLARWLQAHAIKPSVAYVNWVGRTVQNVRQEAALHAALRDRLPTVSAEAPGSATALRDRLVAVIAKHGPLPTPIPPTPAPWMAMHILYLVLGALGLIAFLPIAIIGAIPYLLYLRHRETVDPPITPRPDPAHVATLAVREDYIVGNQFSAFGTVKPGRFRLWTLVFVLWLVSLSTRFIYVRGLLARVGTIHFARWVFLDGRRRLLFASNYDGSLDSYMDDFINKVAFGLNLVFSNGIGYPRTRFLVLDGASDEQAFKNYIRRHQLATEVWYKAYPDLSAADLARNRRIREGFERKTMTETEARAWLSLI
jgi:hypothetical protein